MGSVSDSSCRCCMFVSCVHPVAVLNAAFCMTCSLLMLVEDAIGDHTEEAYSRAGLITALYVAMSVSFCLPHPVAVSAFMICRGLCACTEMLWICVLYVSFGSKVRPRTFGCVAMGVFAITERRDMGLYEVPLSVSLLGFGIGTMLANFHV